MDPDSLWLLLPYILLLALSALFSASETAYSTANKVRLRSKANQGHKRAAGVMKLIDNYDRLLSTLLVGNNIVNIALTTVGTFIFNALIVNAGIAATVSTVVTTVVVLIFGEITPKSIANEKAEAIALGVYPLVKFFYYLLLPINAIFMLWKKLLKKVFKLERDVSVTEDELKTYVDSAESGGEITKHESELIRSAIEFDDLDVSDIMTPRVNVTAIAEDISFHQITALFRDSEFSRMPVYSGTIDSIIGIVHEKDLFLRAGEDTKNNFDIKKIITPSICVSRTMKISAALRLLQKSKVHMAIVVDEYGGTSGIVTIEDIIEELVGEIYDEHDEVEVYIKTGEDGSYIVDGKENLDTMFEVMGVETSEEFDSATVGGFVTELLGKIPVTGEKLEFMNLDITVTKATVKKVAEVNVKVIKEPVNGKKDSDKTEDDE